MPRSRTLSAALLAPIFSLAAQDAPGTCAEIHGVLPTIDSAVVTVVQPNCGRVRVAIVSDPKFIPDAPGHWNIFQIHVVSITIENVSKVPIKLPADIAVDTAVEVDRSHQLRTYISGNVQLAFDGLFTYEGYPAKLKGVDSTATFLAPGQRSAPVTLRIIHKPLAREFRLWVKISGVQPPAIATRGSTTVRRQSPRQGVVPTTIQSFVTAAGLPQGRPSELVYSQLDRDLLVFAVPFGPPQDCPAGCFYTSAYGISYQGRLGWLANYPSTRATDETRFAFDENSPYLLSSDFVERVMHDLPDGNVVEDLLLRGILQSPSVSRAAVERVIDGFYDLRLSLTDVVLSLPSVQHDVRWLTLVANLPVGEWKAGVPAVARRHLHDLAPSIVDDSTATTMELFVLAQTLTPNGNDPVLALRVANNARVKNNIAVLMTLEVLAPSIRPRIIAAVHASDRVKEMVSRYLDRGTRNKSLMSPPPGEIPERNFGWDILADPEAGKNEDVLTVLANAPGYDDFSNLKLAATRRLPESALRRWERIYVPIP